MENSVENKTPKIFLKKGKWQEVLLLGILGLVLIFTVWKLFAEDSTEEALPISEVDQTEEKVSRLLTEIEGVGEAEVMICETEDGVQSVVVVCDGAKNLSVVMTIREAVAAALGTDEKAVKIYLKKE